MQHVGWESAAVLARLCKFGAILSKQGRLVCCWKRMLTHTAHACYSFGAGVAARRDVLVPWGRSLTLLRELLHSFALTIHPLTLCVLLLRMQFCYKDIYCMSRGQLRIMLESWTSVGDLDMWVTNPLNQTVWWNSDGWNADETRDPKWLPYGFEASVLGCRKRCQVDRFNRFWAGSAVVPAGRWVTLRRRTARGFCFGSLSGSVTAQMCSLQCAICVLPEPV